MVYIKGLKFRGFKSFRRAEASFPQGFVCLAGPNGSGKSNVTDGIRFALGEGSLKALRAKRVSELINTSSKYAEVTLFIDGERQYEIRRGINEEGKTFYRINGKKSTRTLVMEELRPLGLEAGSHNIIAQGQVQKIVEMSAKERRGIIDGVSGISEFDLKKDEALRELEKVEQKIKDATIVLGEREAQLSELEREKNDALSYLAAQESFRRAMASIATSEYAKLSKTQSDVIQKHSQALSAKEEVSKNSSVLSARLSELDSQRQQVSAKIGSSASREAAMREIEELKVRHSSESATMQERKKDLSRIESESKAAQQQLADAKKSLASSVAARAAIEQELQSASEKISRQEPSEGKAGQSEEIAKKIESTSEKIISLKEQKAQSESSASNAKKLLEVRKEERERLAGSTGGEASHKLEGERSILQKEVLAHESSLEALFEKEKELNRRLPELDRQLLSIKEKAATLRANLSPAATSLSLRAVEDLKSGGLKGIFGAVSSLVTCEPKYASAVEAAAGQRLNYVVVDRMDTAIKVIQKLKEQRSGRCTFIPLDVAKGSESSPPQSAQGCLGRLMDFVDFNAAYLQAMQYVFSDTLLYDTVANAKKAGVGSARMVTLDGELIERSGIITGGAQKTSLLSRSSLDKAESEAKSVSSQRDSIYSELYALREEMSAKRKEKASAEVKLKGIEIEIEASSKLKEAHKKAREALTEIESHISSLEAEARKWGAHAAKLSGEIEAAIAEYESLKTAAHTLVEKQKKEDEKSQKELQKLHALHSSLAAKLEAAIAEQSRLKGQEEELLARQKELSAQHSSCKKELSQLEGSIQALTGSIKEKEAKLSELSASAQKLFAKLREIEAQSSEVGLQLGKLKAEEDKKNRELMELEVKRQTTETRLSDLKASLEQYSGVPTIDLSKQELEELAKKSQLSMDSLGAVNLRAPEIYEEKKKDIEEIKVRVSSLDTERKAVFSMMDEIEGKKRAIFISTFTAVNDNFKRLFSYVFPGEGTLLLEQPSSPFESGLLVKVKDGGRDKYLDSMSGGEKSLLALIFIFAIQMHKAAPFYILDEADAALDKENSRKLAELVRQLSGKTQFIVVTHNDTVLQNASVALGVTRTEDGSKIVGVQLTQAATVARPKKA